MLRGMGEIARFGSFKESLKFCSINRSDVNSMLTSRSTMSGGRDLKTVRKCMGSKDFPDTELLVPFKFMGCVGYLLFGSMWLRPCLLLSAMASQASHGKTSSGFLFRCLHVLLRTSLGRSQLGVQHVAGLGGIRKQRID